jgi:hypothetical protein
MLSRHLASFNNVIAVVLLAELEVQLAIGTSTITNVERERESSKEEARTTIMQSNDGTIGHMVS